MGLQLTISKGPQQGREYLFEQAEIHIGSTPDNDVVLQDKGVSRRHVRILDRRGRYFVQAVDSAPGAQVNNKRLAGEQELRNGDRIGVGPVELVFKQVSGETDSTNPVAGSLFEDMGAPSDTGQRAAVSRPPSEPEDEMSAPSAEELPSEEDPERETGPQPAVDLAGSTRIGEAPTRRPEPVADASTRIGEAPARRPEPVAEVSTRIVEAPTRRPAATPEPVAEVSTRIVAAPTRRPPVADVTREDLPPVRPGPGAPLARPARAEPRSPVKASSSGASPARLPASESGVSAAEKARRRRELGDTLGGQFLLWWTDLSRGGKAALLMLGSVIVLGVLGALGVVFRPRFQAISKGAEPTSLGLQALPDSFGLGEDVKWENDDMKSFDFEFVSPTRAVAVVHYQASGISKEEVSLSVNAVNLGWVPPDTTNSAERELQQILSPSALKRNELNSFVFDNVRNPPGHDSWRIWNLRVEIIPVPDLRPEELVAAAREYVAKGRNFYDRRAVGAENLFLAWENYRSAWITLEALEDKPDLYQDVRYMLGQISTELDQNCGLLMLKFQRNIQLKDRKLATRVLEDINRAFPTPAYRCHNLAAEKASAYGL